MNIGIDARSPSRMERGVINIEERKSVTPATTEYTVCTRHFIDGDYGSGGWRDGEVIVTGEQLVRGLRALGFTVELPK